MRTLSIVAVIGTACWVSASEGAAVPHTETAKKTIRLKPGHYVFHLGGRVRVGDKIVWVTRSGAPPVAASCRSPGTVSRLAGTVRITCPANPGNG